MVAYNEANFVAIPFQARIKIRRDSNNGLGGIQESLQRQVFSSKLEARKELGIHEPKAN